MRLILLIFIATLSQAKVPHFIFPELDTQYLYFQSIPSSLVTPFSMGHHPQIYRISSLDRCLREGNIKITIGIDSISLSVKHYRRESNVRSSLAAQSRDGRTTLLLSQTGGKYCGGLTLKDRRYDIVSLDEEHVALLEIYEDEYTARQLEDKIPGYWTPPRPTKVEKGHSRFTYASSLSILFLYGPIVESKYGSDQIKAKVNQSIDYMRMARDLSGISANAISYTLAGIAKYNYITLGEMNCPKAGPSDISFLENNEEIDALKRQYDADVVVFISGRYGDDLTSIRGLASVDEEVAIVSWNYANATGVFTAVHEMGHLLGGRHEDGVTQVERKPWYGVKDSGIDRPTFVSSYWHSIMSPNTMNRQLMYGQGQLIEKNDSYNHHREYTNMASQLILGAQKIDNSSERGLKKHRSVSRVIPPILQEVSNAKGKRYFISKSYQQQYRISNVNWYVSFNGLNFEKVGQGEEWKARKFDDVQPWFILRVEVQDHLGNKNFADRIVDERPEFSSQFILGENTSHLEVVIQEFGDQWLEIFAALPITHIEIERPHQQSVQTKFQFKSDHWQLLKRLTPGLYFFYVTLDHQYRVFQRILIKE